MQKIEDIQFLPGVGPQRAKLLKEEIGVEKPEDLLGYFPFRYVDRSRIYTIAELTEDASHVLLCGEIVNFRMEGAGHGERLVATLKDGTGELNLVWFKGIKFVRSQYNRAGVKWYVFGKPERYGHDFSIAHPEVDEKNAKMDVLATGLQPVYPLTVKLRQRNITSRTLQKMIYPLVKELAAFPWEETLPERILTEYAMMRRNEALRNLHVPKSQEALTKARARMKFEELFYIQLSILRRRQLTEQNVSGWKFEVIGEVFNDFYQNHLPFALTGAQKRVLKEIRADVKSGRQMNRLLQGDVGSGKTLVALMSMLMAVDNGFQACMMAPTEILATQHHKSLSDLLEGTSVRIGLLTGSTPKKERERLHADLRSGDLNLLVGTHALIEDTVVFGNLGLAVIDEQHRFGVAQRAKLWRKNSKPPHILVMTATPIPRTLAMTLYGDLRVSVIDELPPGRKPVQTLHYYDEHRGRINEFLRRQIDLGRQVYVVYPLIEESEKIDLKNLTDGYEYVQRSFPDLEVCMVHGKMKPAEKDAQMQRFVSGEAKIMVATTVIEVGVNVPNASVMVIENANRFGLSQLHQLRGRVGRGADQSYCLLMSPVQLSADTKRRLDIMVKTNDGFEISEADLKLRGPGDMDGTQQSGMPFELKVANLAKDGRMVEFARQMAGEILQADPGLEQPEHQVVRRTLGELERKRDLTWRGVS